MLQNNDQKKIEAAQKAVEQARARLEAEKKKQSEKRRRFENHHKFMMGGAVARYFPDCYLFDEKEMNRIIAAAMKSDECLRIIRLIREEAAKGQQAKSESSSNIIRDIHGEDSSRQTEVPYGDN